MNENTAIISKKKNISAWHRLVKKVWYLHTRVKSDKKIMFQISKKECVNVDP